MERSHHPSGVLADDQLSILALWEVRSDGTRSVAQRLSYGDYGNQTVRNPNSTIAAAGTAAALRHGYTGRLHDATSGLTEYRHRWMNPAAGTFLQPDPVGYHDGMNLYLYCKLSPATEVDPYGLFIGCARCTIRCVKVYAEATKCSDELARALHACYDRYPAPIDADKVSACLDDIRLNFLRRCFNKVVASAGTCSECILKCHPLAQRFKVKPAPGINLKPPPDANKTSKRSDQCRR